ncbi:MAG TPA: DUF4123 domain-containing protein [Xanthomonadaceae bacterium]|nr:DUF4123 domain-containing protein [Luteimonas sp.]HRQ66814.1 DUF4123 domain-containing protein [Xanthomonadaceae bacterium]
MPAGFIPSFDWQPPSEGTDRFLLMDGAQCKSTGDLLKRIPGAAGAVRLFDGVLADGTADASVQLLRLPVDTGLTELLRRAAPDVKSPGAISFIDSSLRQDELSRRLMRRLDAKFPNGKEFLVRFFDGRVLPLLVNVLTSAQRHAFEAVGHRWWFVGPDLSWQSLTLTAPDPDPHSSPLQFSDAQRRQLIDDTYPYTLIDHFAFSDQELLDRVPPRDRYRFFRKCFRLSGQYGIRDGKRIVMVCTWALLLNEDFHLDPAWHLRLEDFAAGRRTARDIGDEVWPVVESWE